MSEMELIPVKIGDWLTEYLDLLEKYLDGYSNEFLKKSEKVEGELEEGEVPSYWYEYLLYAEEYPNILRKSFLITCCSILEQELFEECKLQKKFKSIPIDVNDLGGGGIDKAMKYLKLAGLDLSMVKSWDDVRNIQLIRNCLVHSDSVLNCNKIEQIQKYIKTRKDKDISIENDKIILTLNYCRYVVNAFSAFEFDIKSGFLPSNKKKIPIIAL